VFVARRAQRILGYIQLIAAGADWKIESVPVMENEQGQGVGAALALPTLDRAFSAGASRVVVATATANIDNLRFYQQLGFRMDRIERDAFIADRGCVGLEIDHIPVREREWFSIGLNDRR
jgi:GNAT superfamily N-acetyltransferase